MTMHRYDAFAGPDLDPALWAPFEMGVQHVDPTAKTVVGDGVLTVDIAAFTRSSTEYQGVDNMKHVVFSTRGFALPATGVARFSADMAVDHVGGESGDYRLGVAAFNVVDTEGGTGMVFDFLATADRTFIEHEVLAMPGVANPFTRVIESPLHDLGGAGFHHCELQIDRAGGRVTWTVDGLVAHEALGLTGLPESVHLGIAFFTLMPISQGSLRGQGGRASWRDVRYDVGDW